MPTSIGPKRFLQAFFPDHARHGIFYGTTSSGRWFPTRDVSKLKDEQDCYICSGAIPDDGIVSREGRLTEQRFLFIDDVDSIDSAKPVPAAVAARLGPYRLRLQTSEHSYQHMHTLTRPVKPEEWADFWAGVCDVLGMEPECGDAGHICRLPMGRNTKPGRNNWKVSADVWDDASPDIDTDAMIQRGQLFGAPIVTVKPKTIKGDTYSFETLRALVRLIPNDKRFDDRRPWFGVLCKIRAGCRDEADGFAVADEWCRTWLGRVDTDKQVYDYDATLEAWDSIKDDNIKASVGGLRKLAEEIDPAGFGVWKQNATAEAFDDDEVKSGPKPAPHVLVSNKFMEGFMSPDYLVHKLITKSFLYSLTGQTGAGKTSITMRLAATVALGASFGGLRTKPCRVLYMAAENPVDIQMRYIALADEMGFDVNTIPLFFIKDGFQISTSMARLKSEAERFGEFGLVIVDTGPVFLEGDDENDRVAMRKHARMFRELINVIPGRPAVIVNVHPTKNATADDLRPAGGGSFLNEVDGNLTAAKNEDQTIELGWQGKWRGVEFAPLHFQLMTVTHPRLVDSDGDLMPTIICKELSMYEKEELERKEFADQDKLLDEMERNPRASAMDLAVHMGWYYPGGSPAKSKVQRYIKTLIKQKLIRKDRQLWVVPGAIKAKMNGGSDQSDRTGPDRKKLADPKKH